MSASDRNRLRATFEEVAELYDRARPTYPAAVFDDLAELGRLRPGSRVLEIGCGTGKATVDLARRGFRLVCVELGPSLADLARAKLRPFPDVEVITAAFETWEPGARRFDAVVAFSAFHWLDPETGYRKAAEALTPTGVLAIASSEHVAGRDSFWAGVQEDYDAVDPREDNRPPPAPEEVPDLLAEMEASGCFRALAAPRHVRELVYTAETYIDVLETYSGHRALDAAVREELHRRIRRRIAGRPGGRVVKTYLTILNVGAVVPRADGLRDARRSG